MASGYYCHHWLRSTTWSTLSWPTQLYTIQPALFLWNVKTYPQYKLWHEDKYSLLVSLVFPLRNATQIHTNARKYLNFVSHCKNKQASKWTHQMNSPESTHSLFMNILVYLTSGSSSNATFLFFAAGSAIFKMLTNTTHAHQYGCKPCTPYAFAVGAWQLLELEVVVIIVCGCNLEPKNELQYLVCLENLTSMPHQRWNTQRFSSTTSGLTPVSWILLKWVDRYCCGSFNSFPEN